MSRWLPSPLLSIGLLLTWLLLNESVAAAHWLLGGALAVVAPLLVRPLLPHGHARLRLLTDLSPLWCHGREIQGQFSLQGDQLLSLVSV